MFYFDHLRLHLQFKRKKEEEFLVKDPKNEITL